MIRIDYKYEGDYVLTTWVREGPGDVHQMMGRLIFSREDFDNLESEDMNRLHIRFEEKK